ncbi:glycosyltransferase [Castellaniella caeni]|uniref:glycosyltransferase n=1 Tax=Castellaniella caeni TaxID=266123 RepID=UPI000C9FC9B1|nr:glycosyltransferase [Castellaniella caeni]
MADSEIKFSIVTATYNSANVLPRLIASLKDQTDQCFEWVVADGASTDGSLALLEAAKDILKISIDSRADFGVYDALNRAVRIAKGDYYLVVGADDQLSPDAVRLYKKNCLDTKADLVTANIEFGEKIIGVRRHRYEWLEGQFAHVSGHAVGLAIKKSLHKKYGYYSNKFPIAADQLFILNVIHCGGVVHECDFIAGKFGLDGLSSTDSLGSLLESYRVQCLVGHGFIVQTTLLLLRIIKNIRKLRNCR